MGDTPVGAGLSLMLQQQQQFAAALTLPTGAPVQTSKKQRELYVGNLPTAMVSEAVLQELFTQVLCACEGFNSAIGPPVHSVQLCGGGTYAFVEFRDEELAETAMQFNGMELSGRQLKINRPNGHIPSPFSPKPLVPPVELMQKFGIGCGQDTSALSVSVETARKSRELYVGNLTVGVVTNAMLKELFTVPLQALPGNEAHPNGPPVVEAKVDLSGKFAFVEFRDEALATLAIGLFHNMDLCGRPMHVARPAGYVAGPDSAPAAVSLAVSRATAPPPPAVHPVLDVVKQLPVPTRDLCLGNLLSDAIMSNATELAEVTREIRVECESFGAIECFLAATPGNTHGLPEEELGKIFVKYSLVSSAIKAYTALNAREFDGRSVAASFISL